MKRLIIFVVTFLMLFSIAACSTSETTGSDSASTEKESAQQEQTGRSQSSDGNQGLVCESFKAFKEARDAFDNYVIDENYEPVAVGFPTVTAFDANIFDYLLPLDFIGQSVLVYGEYDVDKETHMLQQAWADDAQLTYDEATGYLLKGTGSKGNEFEIKVKFDADADALRLEGYKDGALDLLFEYLAIDGGYAAQYYLETITGYDKTTPIMGICNHKLIFAGNNGSRARFDNVAEPESILGTTPDPGSFIDGATHWFTVENGEFTGNINGTAF